MRLCALIEAHNRAAAKRKSPLALHPTGFLTTPNRNNFPAHALAIIFTKRLLKFVQPMRMRRDVIVREGDHVPSRCFNTRVPRMRKALPRFKNITNARARICGKDFYGLGAVVGTVVIYDDQFPSAIGGRAQLCEASENHS